VRSPFAGAMKISLVRIWSIALPLALSGEAPADLLC
jgi:hypothetical protein